MRFRSIHGAILMAALLVLASCRSGSPVHEPVIGQAFVGPATLKIHSDISLQSAVVATVKHGERLEILARRRMLMRVRTPAGTEGWTEERQLLAAADMASLKELAQRAAKMASQGKASSYSDLNAHTQPSRAAPSFLQIRAGEKFDVLATIPLPRTELPRAPLVAPMPKKQPKKAEPKGKLPPPPMPKPPTPPADWLELSGRDSDEPVPEPAEPAERPAPALEYWSLVRVSTGQAGWVLTRFVAMAIPDEVAQYAEGHRIVSYFSLGQLTDHDERKDIWLWTTVGSGIHDYDFDSFRVFVFSFRHHRYETSHVERNLEGYLPVLAEPAGVGGRTGPGFSICMVNRAGQRVRRGYALLGGRVRPLSDSACPATPPVYMLPAASAITAAPAAPPPPRGFLDRLKARWKALTK
ncbi:MAG: SH3 domain-containing protein [Bryobacteraceae bacterium]